METNVEAPQATIQAQPAVQATAAPESAQQSIDAILASVLDSVDERGEMKEGAQEAVKEAPKAETKAETKVEPPKDSVAKLMAAAVRRDREAGEKLHNAEKMAKEAQAKEERFAKIESALRNKNYSAFIKMLDPEADPNAVVVEAFASLDNDEKPLTQEEIRAQIRAEIEADFRAKQEAEKAEKQRLLDEAKKDVDQAFTGYVGECEQLVKANASEYPILSSPRQFEKARADMLAFAEMVFDKHKQVPSHKALLDQVEKELAADMGPNWDKAAKKHGWQQGQFRPTSSPTITPRMTSAEQGMASPASSRERSIAEEMEAIQASIAQRFGA